MSVVEIYGGRVDRRYLMKKSKDELATMYLHALDLLERRTQPEATKDDSLRTTLADLAMALWRTHYRNDSPNFELLPDAAGILSQIDNMVSGLVKPEATKPAQDLGAVLDEEWLDLWCPESLRISPETASALRWLLSHAERYIRAALASPADALVAGDREKTKRYPTFDFYCGVIAALGALAPHCKHGDTIHDEIVRSVGKEALYKMAEPEDVTWAALDPDFYAAIQAQKDGHGTL